MPPKPTYKRRKPTLAQRNKFNTETIEQIRQYFNGKCAECGVYTDNKPPHHIKFKSQGGRGTKTNGLWLCPDCHERIHKSKALTDKWRRWAIEQFGEDYYKDEWD